MLKITIAVIIIATAKVALCLYMWKMVLTAAMAEYKLEFSYKAPTIIVVVKTIEVAIKPSQTKVATHSVEP